MNLLKNITISSLKLAGSCFSAMSGAYSSVSNGLEETSKYLYNYGDKVYTENDARYGEKFTFDRLLNRFFRTEEQKEIDSERDEFVEKVTIIFLSGSLVSYAASKSFKLASITTGFSKDLTEKFMSYLEAPEETKSNTASIEQIESVEKSADVSDFLVHADEDIHPVYDNFDKIFEDVDTMKIAPVDHIDA